MRESRCNRKAWGGEQMKVKFILVVLLLCIFVSVLFICLVVLRNELPTVHSV